MQHTTYDISHGKGEDGELGWHLHFHTYSPVRQFLSDALMRVCGLTGHRLERINGRVANWAFRKETRLFETRIEREEAWKLHPEFVTEVEELEAEEATARG